MWRTQTPKELVYGMVKQKKPNLTENTLKTYASQLGSFLRTLGVHTMGGAYQKSAEAIEKAVNEIENMNSRSSQLNAFLSVLKYAEIPMSKKKFKRLSALNDELGKEKMKPMEEGTGEAPPQDYEDKINAFLKNPQFKGTREAVYVAMMSAIPLRPKQLEDVRIARSQKEYEDLKNKGESVLSVFENSYKLWTKPENRKVKKIDDPAIFKDRAMEALKAYLTADQIYLFPSYKNKEESVKSQRLEKAIKQAFEKVGLGFIGSQKLRRIGETKNQSNPTKSREAKEQYSKQLNHSLTMGDKYRVITDFNIEREDEAETQYLAWGKMMSQLNLLMLKQTDASMIEAVNMKLLKIIDMLK